MKLNDKITTMYLGNYDNEVSPNYSEESSGTYTGGSQVLEPQIIAPIYNQNQTNVIENEVRADNIQDILNQQTTTNESLPTNEVKPNKVSEPSATTEENKTYVNGGTTPDSNIVVNKPRTNFVVYGIVGLVGLLVVYKLFFYKKTE